MAFFEAHITADENSAQFSLFFGSRIKSEMTGSGVGGAIAILYATPGFLSYHFVACS